MFEVYQYRPYTPDPRGKRNAQVWDWPLTTRQEQVEHWSRALRAYTFKIPFDPGRQTVVLAATFALDGGTPRLFDQIILEPTGRTPPTGAAPGGAKKPPRPPRPRRPRPDRAPTTQPVAPQPPTTQPVTAPDTPEDDASADPGVNPGADPGVSPGADSGAGPAADPPEPSQPGE
jgi:hypothetical protein